MILLPQEIAIIERAVQEYWDLNCAEMAREGMTEGEIKDFMERISPRVEAFRVQAIKMADEAMQSFRQSPPDTITV